MQGKVHASADARSGRLSMDVLVGSTGLIGSVLRDNHHFQYCFNSSNIHTAPLLTAQVDKLYLACLPAEKWKANQQPLEDFANMHGIVEAIKHWQPREVVLYSTIDVYSQTYQVKDIQPPEVAAIDYGITRYIFELLIKQCFPRAVVTIIRLPALFHARIKKNALYDLLNGNNIAAICSTSAYQWYCLEDLWNDTENVAKGGIHHFFSEPIAMIEIIARFFPEARDKAVGTQSVGYDCKPYFTGKKQTLAKMEKCINDFRN
jgi:hypothetical protein